MNEHKCCGRKMIVERYYIDKKHSIYVEICWNCGKVVYGNEVLWYKGVRSA